MEPELPREQRGNVHDNHAEQTLHEHQGIVCAGTITASQYVAIPGDEPDDQVADRENEAAHYENVQIAHRTLLLFFFGEDSFFFCHLPLPPLSVNFFSVKVYHIGQERSILTPEIACYNFVNTSKSHCNPCADMVKYTKI